MKTTNMKLLWKLLEKQGTITNGEKFNTLPCDERDDIIRGLLKKFEASVFNNPDKTMGTQMEDFLKVNTNLKS